MQSARGIKVTLKRMVSSVVFMIVPFLPISSGKQNNILAGIRNNKFILEKSQSEETMNVSIRSLFRFCFETATVIKTAEQLVKFKSQNLYTNHKPFKANDEYISENNNNWVV